jgi:hypothetical protein
VDGMVIALGNVLKKWQKVPLQKGYVNVTTGFGKK